MKKWTWQWFIVLAILGMLFSCGAWIDRQPYDIDEDVYKPDRPWKQMIWKARVEIGDCRFVLRTPTLRAGSRFEIADCRCGMRDVKLRN
jgi:hypothetical protein